VSDLYEASGRARLDGPERHRSKALDQAKLAVSVEPSEVTALVKKLLVPGLAVLALSAPALAEADPGVGGFLSIKSAIQFQKTYFPSVAPRLLRDNRATFFRTKRPIRVNSCTRVNRATVICRFSLILNPNAAHRKAHWFPIRCRGKVRSRHRVDNSIIGDVRGYKCRTILALK
jgi:hypothetical protein